MNFVAGALDKRLKDATQIMVDLAIEASAACFCATGSIVQDVQEMESGEDEDKEQDPKHKSASCVVLVFEARALLRIHAKEEAALKKKRQPGRGEIRQREKKNLA